MSINFRLDVSAYQQQLMEYDHTQLKALVVVQYPVYWLRATVRQSSDSALQELDRRLLQLMKKTQLEGFDMANLLGINKSLVSARFKVLEREDLIRIKDWQLTEEGEQLLSEPQAIQYETVKKDYYLDGITHAVLPDDFVDKCGRFFIKEKSSFQEPNDRGKTGDAEFNPDIPHKPMSIVDLEMSFAKHDAERNIQLTTASDPVRMTCPFLAVLAVNEAGVQKYMINGFDRMGNFFGNLELGSVDQYLSHLNITSFEHQSKERDAKSYVHFATNWDNARVHSESEQRVFNIDSGHFRLILNQKYRIEVTVDDILVNNDILGIKVTDTMVLNSSFKVRQKLLLSLLKGHDEIVNRQLQQRIYVVIYHVVPAETNFMQDLLNVFRVCNQSVTADEAIEQLEPLSEFLELPVRKLLVISGAFKILETWDIQKHVAS